MSATMLYCIMPVTHLEAVAITILYEQQGAFQDYKCDMPLSWGKVVPTCSARSALSMISFSFSKNHSIFLAKVHGSSW